MSVFTDLWILPSDFVKVDNLQKGDGIKLKNPLGEKFWVKFLYKEKDI